MVETNTQEQQEPFAVFERGDRGEGVRELQQRLTDQGFDVGDVDGIIGRRTVAAALEYQTAAGLPKTNVFDGATYNSLMNAPASTSNFLRDESALIAQEQEPAAVGETPAPVEAAAVEEETVVDAQPTGTPSRDELIDSVFRAEGGYSNDRGDTGNYYNGIFIGTNHGISAPVLAEYLGRTPSVQDMRDLTQDEAREIAATNYYDRYSIDSLPEETREIVFHAVYMGGSRGIRAVQNLTGQTPDGQLGPATRRGMRNATFTPAEFRDEYLRELEFGTEGHSSPAATWNRHGRGWTNRYNALAGD